MTTTLPPDYFDKYADAESGLREAHEFAYVSRPQFVDREGRTLVLAPWGMPGSASPVIFPFAHYVVVTLLSDDGSETLVLEQQELLAFLSTHYPVHEVETPVFHWLVELPDDLVMAGGEDEAFLEAIRGLPRL